MSQSSFHERLLSDLRDITHVGPFKSEAETKELSIYILGKLRSGSLSHNELQDIQTLVQRIYSTKDKEKHVRAFEFIKKVINELGDVEGDEEIAMDGPIFGSLYSLYFKTIFIDATDSGILTGAIEHAAEYLDPANPLSLCALEAFELSWFCMYPIKAWTKDNVRDMLCIASEKIRHRSLDEGALICFNTFLERVCLRKDKSCGIVACLSNVVADIYYMLQINGNIALCKLLNQSLLFHEILSHVDETLQTNCWLAVATFLKVLFSCDDHDTFRVLSREKVSSVMTKMFMHLGPESKSAVIEQLLLAVQAACSHLRIDSASDSSWIAEIIPYVIRNVEGGNQGLRSKACGAYEAYIRDADPREIIEQPLWPIVQLLSSSEIPVLCIALKWLFQLIDKFEAEPSQESLSQTMKTKIRGSKAIHRLRTLASSRESIIRQAVAIIFLRLDPRERRTPEDEALRDIQRQYMLHHLRTI